jgi:hypothetical protein
MLRKKTDDFFISRLIRGVQAVIGQKWATNGRSGVDEAKNTC